GLKETIVSRGHFADIDSPYGPLTDEQRSKLRHEIEIFYKGFVDRVATSRNRKYEEIEPLAQGRVWLGAQAKQNGLIDEIGGMDRAGEMIKEPAKIGASQKVSLVPYPPKRSLFELLTSKNDETSILESEARRILGAKFPLRALSQGGMLRMMPFHLDVR